MHDMHVDSVENVAEWKAVVGKDLLAATSVGQLVVDSVENVAELKAVVVKDLLAVTSVGQLAVDSDMAVCPAEVFGHVADTDVDSETDFDFDFDFATVNLTVRNKAS